MCKIITLISTAESAQSSISMRFALESIGYKVRMELVGSGDDFIDALLQTPKDSIVILDGHGSDGGYFIPEIHSSVEQKYGIYDHLVNPLQLSPWLKQRDGKSPKLIISTACTTGTDEWAEMFFSFGCIYYIGYSDHPIGNSVSLFLDIFFRVLGTRGNIESSYVEVVAAFKKIVGILYRESDDSLIPTLFAKNSDKK